MIDLTNYGFDGVETPYYIEVVALIESTLVRFKFQGVANYIPMKFVGTAHFVAWREPQDDEWQVMKNKTADPLNIALYTEFIVNGASDRGTLRKQHIAESF